VLVGGVQVLQVGKGRIKASEKAGNNSSAGGMVKRAKREAYVDIALTYGVKTHSHVSLFPSQTCRGVASSKSWIVRSTKTDGARI